MNHELKLAMLGMIEGNGHPYSWSGIINGYNPEAMAKCPYAAIPAYMGRQPLDSVRIPGARVTSGLRGPNDPLTKANPRSFHTTGGAVDIKPIPGMTVHAVERVDEAMSLVRELG